MELGIEIKFIFRMEIVWQGILQYGLLQYGTVT